MKLLIVESPTKTKSIGKYLGGDYEVMATMGHIRDLPKSKMGIEIEGGKIDLGYEVVEGREEQVKKLQRACKGAEKVILATDPDREGEAISWHTAKLLEEKDKKVSGKIERVVFHSITKEAILEAIEHPRALDMALVDAQQARRVLDRLVGYKLSPLLWKKVRRGLSAGRVQSVAVRLIVDREREIEAFKSVEFWEIRVDVGFWLDLVKIDGKKANIHDEGTARKIEEDLKKASLIVEAIEKKERRVRPHPPFKTSTLQQAAANVLGWSSKKTMSVAQKLYEQGSITYHRTDSLNLVGSAVETIRQSITKEWGNNYLPEKPRFYKTSGKVVAQEAHEAIRPTTPTVSQLGGVANTDEEKLYNLVWRRTMASQMADAVYDSTKITVGARHAAPVHSYLLQVIGEVQKFDGWRKLYKGDGDSVILPELSRGQGLEVGQVEVKQKFTEPPARYNDASLVKELEKRGIGRPSTYAPTISTIIERRYVDRKERKFFPTTVGMAVVDFLVANFPQEMAYEFTAGMEDRLDGIARGKEKWKEMILKFYLPFEKKIGEIDKTAKRVGVAAEGTGEACPLCKEGEVVIREGKFGKFYSCSRFPECKYTARLIEYLSGAKCELCGARVVIKKTRTGREFFGCEKYPSCKWASWKKPKSDLSTVPEGGG